MLRCLFIPLIWAWKSWGEKRRTNHEDVGTKRAVHHEPDRTESPVLKPTERNSNAALQDSYQANRESTTRDNRAPLESGTEVGGIRTLVPVSQMDPLLEPVHQNQTTSLLLRLPDEMLLEIMEYLDGVGLMCLRRTSRVFLRLFAFSSFRQYHMGRSARGFQRQDRPWHRSDVQHILSHPEDPRFCFFKDWYCAACLDMLQTKRDHQRFWHLVNRRLYCAGCERSHSAGLFSALQRSGAKRDFERVCIAHEGHIRICEHAAIGLSDVQTWVQQFKFLGRDGEPYRYEKLKASSLCPSDLHGAHRCGAASRRLEQGVMLEVSRFDNNLSLRICWEAHVDPPKSAMSSKPTAEEMRKLLRSIEKSCPSSLKPSSKPSQPTLMRCFDPNVCSCLRYEGDEAVDWQMWPPNDSVQSCRTNPDKGVFPLSRKRGISSWHCCIEYSPNPVSFWTSVRSCYLDWLGCSNIVVGYNRELKLGLHGLAAKVDAHKWGRVVDVESYGLEKDDDSRHILWCPEEDCRNYYSRYDQGRFRDMTF